MVKIVINIQICYKSLQLILYEVLFLIELLDVLNVTQTNKINHINQLVMADVVSTAAGVSPLGLGLAGAGLATSLIGNIFGGGANKKAMRLVDDQIADLTAWKDTQVNQDPLKSNVGRNIMRKALDTAKQQAKTIDSKSAITGSSAEKNIAEKANVQKGLTNTMSNIAGYATAREDQIEGRYRSNLSNLLGQKSAILQGKAQSGSNLASNAGSFVSGLAPMFAN